MAELKALIDQTCVSGVLCFVTRIGTLELRSLEKTEGDWLLFSSVGSNASPAFISWSFTSEHSKMLAFLGCEHQILHLELFSLNSLPSVWEVYQFSWRVPTVPLAFDMDATICKAFYLWKKQNKESKPDHLVPGSELQTDFICEMGLI